MCIVWILKLILIMRAECIDMQKGIKGQQKLREERR